MKRWQNYVDGMAEEPEGPYVLWEDHAAEIETMVEYAHRLEDSCVAAEEERNSAEAEARRTKDNAIEMQNFQKARWERQRRHREWALEKARHWMRLRAPSPAMELVRELRGALYYEHEQGDLDDCDLLARADAFLRGSGAEVARKELLGALAVASLLKAAGHALRSYQYGNGSTELAKNIADKIDAAFADVPPAPSREKGARDGGERGSGAEQGIFQAGFARGLAEGHGPEKPQEPAPKAGEEGR